MIRREEIARRRLAEEKMNHTRRITTAVMLAVYALLGVGCGVVLVFLTAYGALSADNMLRMALAPTLASVVLFPLLYGAGYGVFHRVAATRPQKKKLARCATGTALLAAVLTMVLCIVFDLV